MKKYPILLVLAVWNMFAYAQYESQAPLTGNPDLIGRSKEKAPCAKNNGSIDSTFIYYPDTLSLPFFDEFSSNHFQVYDIGFGDPGVTSQKEYLILDESTLLPVNNSLALTAQQTFKRVVDINTATYQDIPFVSTTYQVGDFTSFPVVYTPTDLYPPYFIYDTLVAGDVSDTVWIPNPEFKQDSATQFFYNLNNPNAYWLENQAYHNYRFALNPRSLGVVSFDGLDEHGYPYAFGSTFSNYADVLTSKPIDLSTQTPGDSVYFSFLYQKEGLGDVPEASDSLVLEFYAVDLDQWFRVWSTSGGAVSTFKVGHLKVTEQKYLKKGFQFRFKNYGSLSGMLDLFHIDYVHLRALSGYQDTLFKDFAFSYPVGSLIKDYTSVPWDHFKNNPSGKMQNALPVMVHNGSNLMENNQNGTIVVAYNGVTEQNYSLPGQTLSGGMPNYSPLTTYTSFHDLSGTNAFDPTKTGDEQVFQIKASATAQFPNDPQNDTTKVIQYFGNYYSWDDGTAEAAYGPTGNQARLAIRYEAYEEDSLFGVAMHFVPSVNDVSGKLFLLTVWADDGGEPGQILYEDDVFFPRQPIYESERNAFHAYFFPDSLKLPVGSVFYVGWRQFDSDRLNIGLDKNLDNSSNTLYSLNGGISWVTSSIPGSVMIRPLFSTSLNDDIGLGVNDTSFSDFSIFPNPASTEIHVKGDQEVKFVDVYSTEGQKVQSVRQATVDLSMLPQGVYFLQVNGASKFYKCIKL
jgi:hypothetical protein